ncbi:MAG: DUF1674 domain-containing protein [Emcibacter sp.]|nr:DUF1674 domain-containing protein [Emcibacter sp.]
MKDQKNNQEDSHKKPLKEKPTPRPKEIGGRKGLEPTRYGDWENDGIVSDF